MGCYPVRDGGSSTARREYSPYLTGEYPVEQVNAITYLTGWDLFPDGVRPLFVIVGETVNNGEVEKLKNHKTGRAV
jgi:hypothetical protein